MQFAALGLAFLLEMVAFVGFAGLGFMLQSGTPIRIVASVMLFILLIIFWSMFMAPRAVHKFQPAVYYLCKTIIYSLAAFVIWQKISPILGGLFFLLALIDEALLFKHNLS